MSAWLGPCVLAVVFWGISMFLPKLAIKRLPPFHMTIYSYTFFLIGSVLVQAFYDFKIGFDPFGVSLAVAVGVIGGIAQILYNIALRTSSMTYCVVVTSLYPAVATLLAYIFMDETLTLRQVAGIALGTAAIIFMVKADDRKAESQ